MRLAVETSEKKQRILVVGKSGKRFMDILKRECLKYQAEIYVSPVTPKKLDPFDYCFFVNEYEFVYEMPKYKYQKIIIVFINKKHLAEKITQFITRTKFKNIKIINLGEYLHQGEVDKIIWFAFSEDREIFLDLASKIIKKPQRIPKYAFSFSLLDFLRYSKKRAISFSIALIILSQVLFIPPLFLSTYLLYQGASNLQNNKITRADKYFVWGSRVLNIAKNLYKLSRPTYLFFSIAFWPDNLIEINTRIDVIASEISATRTNSTELSKLILKKNKSRQEVLILKLRLKKLKDQVTQLLENITFLSQKLPEDIRGLQLTKKELGEIRESLLKAKKILSRADYLLGQQNERKYLLLFANNMELRPGGGFIGSFGVVTFKDYTLNDLKIYDVYDADGQLKSHVEPPVAIRLYLNQPHWFLRDSAFSPDFLENYKQAKFFLEKELGMSGFSGGILITTTAIQNVLKAFADIYLTDYKEIINSQNFYLKTQLYSEKDFFPGSIQKKTFLGSLTTHLLLNLEDVSPLTLFSNLKKSLDEKQIAVFFQDPKTQSLFDTFSWSGRIIEATCTNKLKNCVNDYLFPYEANLGVNKANFFITRLYNLKIKINSQGEIVNQLSVRLVNDSLSDVFPGGEYDNYFQTLLSKDAKIKRITKNGTLVEGYDETLTSGAKIIGFFMKIKPKSIAEIKIDYILKEKLEKGRGVYQLTVQKQIGTFNDDFVLELRLPKNIYLLNQNISALAKDNAIVYNTNLSVDKFFVFELIKE